MVLNQISERGVGTKLFQTFEGGRLKRRKFLLLQGPVGPFFKHLQKELNAQGHDAWRVTFNAGDRLFSGTEKAIGYTGKANDIEIWLRALLQNNHFDAVVLFGSDRKIHVVAREICQSAGIPVISLEEGYIRPGYIAVESGGNNWNSPVAGKAPTTVFDDKLPVRKDRGRSSLHVMGRYATFYYIAHGLFSGLQERQLFHKPTRARIVNEFFCWIRNAIRKQRNMGKNTKLIQNLLEFHENKYFLVPFQVCDDSQLAPEAALGWTNESLAAFAIESFARSAPKDFRLVFKVHPLDRGHTNYSKQLSKLAELHQISDRIDLLDDGSFGLLMRHSAGLVTINSSSAISAINHNRPIALFGRAIYGHASIVSFIKDKVDLDRFWRFPGTQNQEVGLRYLAWLRAQCMVYGDFYLEDEIPRTSESVIVKCIQIIDEHHARNSDRKLANKRDVA